MWFFVASILHYFEAGGVKVYTLCYLDNIILMNILVGSETMIQKIKSSRWVRQRDIQGAQAAACNHCRLQRGPFNT